MGIEIRHSTVILSGDIMDIVPFNALATILPKKYNGVYVSHSGWNRGIWVSFPREGSLEDIQDFVAKCQDHDKFEKFIIGDAIKVSINPSFWKSHNELKKWWDNNSTDGCFLELNFGKDATRAYFKNNDMATLFKLRFG